MCSIVSMATTVDLSFNTMGSTGWSTSYGSHTYEPTGADYKVVFSNFSKQTSTITDIPVTKSGNIVISLKNNKTFQSVKFTLKQWGSKAKTAKLQYSVNGTTFTDFNPAISSSNFSIEATSIPEGTVAIKLDLSANPKNQVAVASIDYEVVTGGPSKEEVTLTWSETSKTILLNEAFVQPTLTVSPEAAASSVVYSSSNSELLAVTTDGTMTLTPNVAGKAVITATIPAEDEKYSYAEAKYTLTVKDPNAKGYVLVTDASQLVPNSEVLLVNAAASKALGTTQNTNDRNAVSVEIADNEVTPVEGAEIITIEQSGNNWAFKTASGYLAAGSTSSNSLKTQDASVAATVTITSAGVASITFQNISSRNLLQYNSSSNFFRCYSSAQSNGDIQIYQKAAEVAPKAPEAVVVTAGDRTFENDGEYEIEAGTVVNIAAEGATSIKIEAGDGSEAIVSEGASTTWTPAVGEYIPTITATNEAGSVDITFTLTVIAPKQPNGLAYETTTFELTTANAGDFSAPELTNPYNLPVTYSSSNEDLAVVMEDGQVIVDSKPGTATITATFAGNDTYSAGSVSYTINVTKVYTSIADVLTADNNAEIRFDFPMTVGYVSEAKNNCYVTDGKGGYILVFDANKSISYAAGDVIPAGWTAKYTVFNGLPEIAVVGYTLPESTETGEYEIATVSAADLASQPLCRIVKVEGVTFTEATPATNSEFTGTSAETTIGFYNQMKLASVAAGDYDVTVIVSVFDKTATAIAAPGQFIPVEYYLLPIDAPTIKIDGVEFTDFDTAIDLQKGTKTVTITAVDESHHIYHKHSATGNAENVAPLADTEDGYTWVQSHTADIPVSLNGTLSFYAQHPVSGAKSEVKTLTFVGDSTAIFEVEAGVSGEAEWFDLTGRRVAKPAKGGVYIIKEGSKTSKRAF